ncbi:hypothetical protein RHMOL_Rhmol13G0073600 [Rhododendron molle]|uniref:Uncharacterized protein n=1 Tax=Rhododendron molle TaxID=49168 RepID=A0ACC0L5F9_RHOML|nr:hypothetical protein RHMOL_Rhmol13G0073600 [Rhododendron molle]
MAAAPNGCIRQDWPTLEIVNSKDRFSWRKPLLGVLFPSEVLPNILSIHVPKDRKRDELLWEHTSNGQYTVKSGFFSAYDGIEVAVRNVYDAFAQMKSLQGGLKKCSTSFLGADAWRKESWEGVVAWVLDGADDRGGTLKAGDGEVLKSSLIAFSFLFLSSVSNADMYAMPVLLDILSLARRFSLISVIKVSRQAVGAT